MDGNGDYKYIDRDMLFVIGILSYLNLSFLSLFSFSFSFLGF